jgi:MerR family transcriptional regulator, heat shock protein HspR
VDGTPPRAGRPGGVPGVPAPVPSSPWADPDAAFFTVGQAGDLLGVPAATLRRFDAAGAVSPARSAGGQRRYSSNQLSHARRLVDLVAEGLSLQAATRIAALEDEVASLRQELDDRGAGST